MKKNLETYFSEGVEFFRSNRKLIFFSLLVALVSYGYELFNFSLSIDEEFDSFNAAINMKRGFLNGRWGIYYINLFLFPHSVMPYLPTLITLLCISLTAVLFIAGYKSDTLSKLIFCALFISLPIHAYYMTFNILNYLVGFGMLFSVIAFLLINECLTVNEKWRRALFMLISIILLILTFSIYQALIVLFLFFVFAHHLILTLTKGILETKQIIRSLSVFILVFIVSIALYKFIDYSIRYSFLHATDGLGPYLEKFKGWGSVPFIDTIYNLFRLTIGYLLGRTFQGGNVMYSLLIVIPVILFAIYKKVQGFRNRLLALALLVLTVLSPFMVMYLLGSKLPPRTMVALPLMLAFIWWLAYQYVHRIIRVVLVWITVLFLFSHAYTNTRLFYSTHVAWQADRDMANRIVERIYALDLPRDKKKIPVAFIGKYNHPRNELFFKTDVFGASFFGWDNGRPERMMAFIRTLGVDEFRLVPEEKIESMREEIAKMPSWPYKGSVKNIMGVVVVKLSEEE